MLTGYQIGSNYDFKKWPSPLSDQRQYANLIWN